MLEIRPALQSELAAIVAMLARYFMTAAPAGEVPSEPQSPHIRINEVVAVLLDGQVVGTLQLTFIPGLTFDGGWRAQV